MEKIRYRTPLSILLIPIALWFLFSAPCRAFETRYVEDKGLKLLETGRYDEVVAWADHEIQRNPKNADAMIKAGMAIFYKSTVTGRGVQNAEPYLRRAVAADPLHPMARYCLASIYMKMGRDREAIPELRRTLVIMPGFLPAQLGLVNAYMKTGDGLSALTAYDIALKSHHDYAINQSLEIPEVRRRVRSMELTLFRQMNARFTRILFSPGATKGGAARVLFLSMFTAAAGAVVFAKGWWLRA